MLFFCGLCWALPALFPLVSGILSLFGVVFYLGDSYFEPSISDNLNESSMGGLLRRSSLYSEGVGDFT